MDIVDAHHHFLDTEKNEFQSFLKSVLGKDEVYLPDNYYNQVVKPLLEAYPDKINFVGSVHVECMPDDGVGEVGWVDQVTKDATNPAAAATVKAIVGSCDLTRPDVDSELEAMLKKSGLLRGIRWILDMVGPFDGGKNATHVATKRHDGIDHLTDRRVEFERGLEELAKHKLSFDLQCAPAQLLTAAEVFGRHPDVPLCIDHLGKPRKLLGNDKPAEEDDETLVPNQEELAVWREGMKAMAAMPHVYVKISMCGWAVPGWIRSQARVKVLRDLVRELIGMFGPKRCMAGWNWWKDGALSDSDGQSSVGPSAPELYEYFDDFFSIYSDEEKEWLFSKTARTFYRF